MKVFLHVAFVETTDLTFAARLAEEVGFDGLTISDHMIYPGDLSSNYPIPDTMWPPLSPWPDPWVSIAAMAQVTERMEFFTTIYIAPMRPALQVAKLVSTAAVLSDNRLALGVGAGWMREEFDYMGQDFATRGKRLDETIEVCRALWSGGFQSYDGEYNQFPEVVMNPAPSRPVPILCGGESPAAMRRAAGQDGWISMPQTYDDLKGLIGELDGHRRKAGTLDRDDYQIAHVPPPDTIPDADGLKRLRDLGVTKVFLAPWITDVGQQCPSRELLKRRVEEYGETIAAFRD